MQRNRTRLVRAAGACLLAGLACGARPAAAAEYWLQTGTTAIAGVPMWGYALCGSGPSAPSSCAGAVSVPGPALVVPPGEGLVVHLTNTLPEPTSLVIAGQVKAEAMLPVWFEPAQPGIVYSGARPSGNTSARVRSFDREAAAGGGTATYSWSTLRPGTYLYSSGTHPQTQVQMGLYGALTKDAGVGNIAYSQGATNLPYANQVTLLYSEIDPALHAAVSSQSYGNGGPSSTLDYHPTYFLINGKMYPDQALDPLAIPTLPVGQVAVPAGQSLLLRLLNAGLKTHVPTIIGQYWQVVAEDGNPVPFLANPRQQYSAFLPPGKTLDVLLRPANDSTTDVLRFAIVDSRLFDTSNGSADGGMLAKLAVGPAVLAAPVFDSAPVLAATAGTPYAYPAHATSSAGHALQYSLRTPPGAPAGMTIGAATGLLSWPSPAAGSYPLTLRATDQVAPTLFADQSFTLVVAAAANRPPVAVADTYTAIAHAGTSGAQALAAPGVLANDSDPDANPITAVKVSECTVSGTLCTTSNRVTLGANGALTLASSTALNAIRVTYRAQDNSGALNNVSANTIATINMLANRAPAAAADPFTVPRCTTRLGTTGTTCRTGSGFYVALPHDLVNNDSDPDSATLDAANQLPLAVARVRAQLSGTGSGSTSSVTTAHGTATISGGNIIYVPQYNYTGADSFQYRVRDKLGKESGSTTSNTNNTGSGWATVTVTVQ